MLQLQCHSTTPGGLVERIDIAIDRSSAHVLELTFALTGTIADLLVPAPQPPERADGLWQHTCFEAFVTAPTGYYEFNFAPSTLWAAYRFTGYREDMAPVDIAPPEIVWTAGEGAAQLAVTLRLPPDATGPLGLSAVIEGRDGAKSFWALAHPPGQPDFHHRACFVAELPPAH